MSGSPFDAADFDRLAERGISEEEARRQLELLRGEQPYAKLLRPCKIGDGIRQIGRSRRTALIERFEKAAAGERRRKFVPASGAATRMFRDLLFFQRGEGRGASWDEVARQAADGVGEARTLLRFREALDRFAFRADLEDALRGSGRAPETAGPNELLDALLSDAGIGYASLPKGLLAFHRYDGNARTAFEEHLVEAAGYARDRSGVCRLHFTVSPEHLEGFRTLAERMRGDYEHRFGVRYEIGFSLQKPSTDTIAVDAEGEPFRDPDGNLLLRPGGHGALIENLDELEDDVVFVKNIDNVQPDWRRDATLHWKKVLGGLLIELRDRAFELHRRLNDEPDSVEEALEFLDSELGVDVRAVRGRDADRRRRFVLDRLDRPLRVCGVVPNTGEPGGGPFWVLDAEGGAGLQIVEGAQIDPDDAAQQEILRGSTHFSPVDLACSRRGVDGRPFELRRFVDPTAVIVARKSYKGRALKALERPGLWNGAMAGWNTVFVEVPLETFTPVKTVLDLLRDEHQPPR